MAELTCAEELGQLQSMGLPSTQEHEVERQQQASQAGPGWQWRRASAIELGPSPAFRLGLGRRTLTPATSAPGSLSTCVDLNLVLKAHWQGS